MNAAARANGTRTSKPRTGGGSILVRCSAALLGTLPPSWLGATALAALLPISDGHRAALVMLLAVPAWVVAMSFAFLARRGFRVWCACLATTAVFYVLTRSAHGEATRNLHSTADGPGRPALGVCHLLELHR